MHSMGQQLSSAAYPGRDAEAAAPARTTRQTRFQLTLSDGEDTRPSTAIGAQWFPLGDGLNSVACRGEWFNQRKSNPKPRKKIAVALI